MSVVSYTPSSVTSFPPAFKTTLDTLGEESGVAQGLKGPITTCEKLSSQTAEKERQVLYCLLEDELPVGFVKIGWKHLYLLNEDNKLCEKDPLCVLDFYVSGAKQRGGLGKMVFEGMCRAEMEGSDGGDLAVFASKLAYDRPSQKIIPFLRKNYGLSGFVEQSNNYVVFDGFWE